METRRAQHNHYVLLPGGTPAGQRLRDIVLHGDHLAPRAEALIYAADRAHHVDTVIRPALHRGRGRRDGPVRRLLGRLSGRGARPRCGRGGPAVRMGDWWPGAGPHRRPGPVGRAGPGPARKQPGPARVRAECVSRPGARALPGAGRAAPPPLPRGQRGVGAGARARPGAAAADPAVAGERAAAGRPGAPGERAAGARGADGRRRARRRCRCRCGGLGRAGPRARRAGGGVGDPGDIDAGAVDPGASTPTPGDPPPATIVLPATPAAVESPPPQPRPRARPRARPRPQLRLLPLPGPDPLRAPMPARPTDAPTEQLPVVLPETAPESPALAEEIFAIGSRRSPTTTSER